MVNLMTRSPSPGKDRTAFNLSVYDNAWKWVYRGYYDTTFNGVDWKAARLRHRLDAAAAKNDDELYRAINALLDELDDRHTHAAPAQEFAQSFRHFNVVLGLRSIPLTGFSDGRRRVIEVFAGGPAAAAGVRPGWILVACDGRPPREVIGPGKLKEGQIVRCDFLTVENEPRRLEIAGRQMAVPTFHFSRDVGHGIVLLKFDGFDMPSARWLREQMAAHPQAKGVIIDLRGNPGGHVFALGSILGDVFPHRVDMGKMVHRGKTARWHRLISQRGGTHYRGPLAVLISRYTTSAAEIFAQLVQDYGRGIVVGEKSAGATLTSVFWPLPGDGKLQLSVYDYHSPRGRRVEGNGVIPDIEVTDAEEAIVLGGDDRAVNAAVDALLKQGAPNGFLLPHTSASAIPLP